MENREVLIKCDGSKEMAIGQLEPFQGKLKVLSDENYEKLKNDILELGFSEPISVWENSNTEKSYILNGHQRLETLKRMADEGFIVPENIPVNSVYADSFEQAKRKVLSLTSQFGTMTEESLFDFCAEADIKLETLANDFNFPEINMDLVFKTEAPNFEPASPNEQGKLDSKKEKKCPHCGETL